MHYTNKITNHKKQNIMKRITFIVTFGIILILNSFRVLADTTFVAGTIVNETWTINGSPYCATGDILVSGLTINPGVEVIFLGDYVFDVAGILYAIGNEQDSIRFAKIDTIAGWKGILFQNSVPGTELEWCIIENANTSGIRIMESFPSLNKCTIRNNNSWQGGGGIKISLSNPGDLEIVDCNIINKKQHTYSLQELNLCF